MTSETAKHTEYSPTMRRVRYIRKLDYERDSSAHRQRVYRADRQGRPWQLTMDGERNIFHAWSGHCAYCGAPARQLDHVNANGDSSPSNLVPVCASCNGSKRREPCRDFLERRGLYTPKTRRRLSRKINAAGYLSDAEKEQLKSNLNLKQEDLI